jgi:hypothetical protein
MVLVRQTKQGWSSNQPHAADSLTLVADANSLDLPMPQTHDLFISHSSATKELARHFYYNAIANGLAPWYDEVLLELGDQLETELRHGIESSRSFLLLHSKAAMEKRWVPLEMEISESKFRSDSSFRLVVVKLDDEPLPEFWQRFLYLPWNNGDQPGSVLRLLSSLTGRNPIVQIAAAAVLATAPSDVFVNSSNTIAEHARNYVLYYLAHVKQLLSAVQLVGFEQELRDTLANVLHLSLFEQLPALQGGIIPIAPAVFEMIFANRMRIPPRVTVDGLPDRYSWTLVANTEVACRIAIIEAGSKNPVTHPVPLSISIALDAEL